MASPPSNKSQVDITVDWVIKTQRAFRENLNSRAAQGLYERVLQLHFGNHPLTPDEIRGRKLFIQTIIGYYSPYITYDDDGVRYIIIDNPTEIQQGELRALRILMRGEEIAELAPLLAQGHNQALLGGGAQVVPETNRQWFGNGRIKLQLPILRPGELPDEIDNIEETNQHLHDHTPLHDNVFSMQDLGQDLVDMHTAQQETSPEDDNSPPVSSAGDEEEEYADARMDWIDDVAEPAVMDDAAEPAVRDEDYDGENEEDAEDDDLDDDLVVTQGGAETQVHGGEEGMFTDGGGGNAGTTAPEDDVIAGHSDQSSTFDPDDIVPIVRHIKDVYDSDDGGTEESMFNLVFFHESMLFDQPLKYRALLPQSTGQPGFTLATWRRWVGELAAQIAQLDIHILSLIGLADADALGLLAPMNSSVFAAERRTMFVWQVIKFLNTMVQKFGAYVPENHADPNYERIRSRVAKLARQLNRRIEEAEQVIKSVKAACNRTEGAEKARQEARDEIKLFHVQCQNRRGFVGATGWDFPGELTYHDVCQLLTTKINEDFYGENLYSNNQLKIEAKKSEMRRVPVEARTSWFQKGRRHSESCLKSVRALRRLGTVDPSLLEIEDEEA